MKPQKSKTCDIFKIYLKIFKSIKINLIDLTKRSPISLDQFIDYFTRIRTLS